MFLLLLKLVYFTTSGRLLEAMSLLLPLHSHHSSVMGLEHTIFGRNCRHRLQKVESPMYLCSDPTMTSCIAYRGEEEDACLHVYGRLLGWKGQGVGIGIGGDGYGDWR